MKHGLSLGKNVVAGDNPKVSTEASNVYWSVTSRPHSTPKLFSASRFMLRVILVQPLRCQ